MDACIIRSAHNIEKPNFHVYCKKLSNANEHFSSYMPLIKHIKVTTCLDCKSIIPLARLTSVRKHEFLLVSFIFPFAHSAAFFFLSNME